LADDTRTTRAHSKSALLRQLMQVREFQRSVIDGGATAPEARVLALWQSRRLAATYRDFERQPRYAKAVAFFLEDLYGPQDFAQRDADVEKLYPLMSRTLPAAALDALCGALELHALTQELDAAMLKILCNELGMKDRLTPEMWVEAYQRTGRRADRERQVALTVQAGRLLDVVVKRPMVYTLVLLARAPARAAGFGDLQDFVERGFKSFRSMEDATDFIAAVQARETSLMQGLFDGEMPAEWQHDPGTLSVENLPA